MKKTYNKPYTTVRDLHTFGYVCEVEIAQSGEAGGGFEVGAKKRAVESDGFYQGFKDDVFEDDF